MKIYDALNDRYSYEHNDYQVSENLCVIKSPIEIATEVAMEVKWELSRMPYATNDLWSSIAGNFLVLVIPTIVFQCYWEGRALHEQDLSNLLSLGNLIECDSNGLIPMELKDNLSRYLNGLAGYTSGSKKQTSVTIAQHNHIKAYAESLINGIL